MATRGWQDVTQADLNRRTLKMQPKPSKYRSVKKRVGDDVFDSGAEADYWLSLKAREQAGEITNLRRQVPFPLYAPAFHMRALGDVSPTVWVQVAVYLADFVFNEAGERRVLDKKGHRTALYSLKRKWLELQDGIIIEEV